MSLSILELMRPRWVAIADFPCSTIPVGKVIAGEEGDYFDRYPHLFRRLNWWEERPATELPIYMKDTFRGMATVKVHQWGREGFISEGNAGTKYWANMDYWEPGTEEDYIAWQNRPNAR